MDSIYQYIVYIILHYCSFWMILTCLIAALLSWRLFTLLQAQSLSSNDAYLTWWSTAIWGGAAVFFFLAGLLLS